MFLTDLLWCMIIDGDAKFFACQEMGVFFAPLPRRI